MAYTDHNLSGQLSVSRLLAVLCVPFAYVRTVGNKNSGEHAQPHHASTNPGALLSSFSNDRSLIV